MKGELPDDHFDESGLDEALARFVTGELSCQSGRAEASFLAARRRARQMRWTSAIAAAVVMALGGGVAAWIMERPAKHPIAKVLPKANETPVVECVTYDKTFDAGAAEVNGVPGRAYRREIVEQTDCFDPTTRTTVSTTVPHEQWEIETLEQY
ncbi:MAG: hypothetical protein ABSH22_00230 [Tepidisphaeraceae bacterium]